MFRFRNQVTTGLRHRCHVFDKRASPLSSPLISSLTSSLSPSLSSLSSLSLVRSITSINTSSRDQIHVMDLSSFLVKHNLTTNVPVEDKQQTWDTIGRLNAAELWPYLNTAIESNAPEIVIRLLNCGSAGNIARLQSVSLSVGNSSLTRLTRAQTTKIVGFIAKQDDTRYLQQLHHGLLPLNESNKASNGGNHVIANHSILDINISIINECINHCIRRKRVPQALNWYALASDAGVFPSKMELDHMNETAVESSAGGNRKVTKKGGKISNGLVPNAATYAQLIPALSEQRPWDDLMFVLEDMRLLNIAKSKAGLEFLIAKCEDNPKGRWRHAQSFLLELAALTVALPINPSTVPTVDASRLIGPRSETVEKALKTILAGSSLMRNTGIVNVVEDSLTSIRSNAEVLNTWNQMQAIIQPSSKQEQAAKVGLIANVDRVDRFLAYPLGAEAARLGNASVIVQLLSSALSNSGKKVEKAVPRSADETCNEIFSIMMSADQLWNKPTLFSCGLAWLLRNSEIGMALDVWTRTHRAMEEYSYEYQRQHYGAVILAPAEEAKRGPKLAPSADRSSETLSLLCRCLSNQQYLSPLVHTSLTAFARDIVQNELHQRLAKQEQQDQSSATRVPARRVGEKRIKITNELASDLISLFGTVQDSTSASAVFMLSESDNVVFDQASFTKLSHMIYETKDYTSVHRLLEIYLSQQQQVSRVLPVSADKGERNLPVKSSSTLPVKRNRAVAQLFDPSMFSPALKALVEMEKYDELFTVLNEDMPSLGIVPLYSQIIIALKALRRSHRYAEAVALYSTYFTVPSTAESPVQSAVRNDDESMDSAPAKAKSSRKKKSKITKPKFEDPYRAAFGEALSSCMEGQLGVEALSLLASVNPRVQGWNIPHQSTGFDSHLAERVIFSLANPELIEFVPKLLEALSTNGHERRALLLTRGILVSSLAAAISSRSKEVTLSVMKKFQQFGYVSDEELVFDAANLSISLPLSASGTVDEALQFLSTALADH